MAKKIYSIEDLLRAESVDWAALSKDPSQLCSPLAVRYFAKDIDWTLYLLSHRSSVNEAILSYGSRYFEPKHYSLVCQLGYADEAFLRQHLGDVSFRDIILFCRVSDEFLVEYLDRWKDIPNVGALFRKSKWFDEALCPQTSVILKTL